MGKSNVGIGRGFPLLLGSLALSLALLSSFTLAWFTNRLEIPDNRLSAGTVESRMELWMQLSSGESGGDSFPTGRVDFDKGGETGLSRVAASGEPSEAPLELVVSPGETVKRRLLVRNQGGIRAGFRLRFQPPDGAEIPGNPENGVPDGAADFSLGEALQISLFQIQPDGSALPLHTGLDGGAFRRIAVTGAAAPGEYTAYELWLECAATASAGYHGSLYRMPITLEAAGTFRGIHYIATGDALETLLGGETLENGDTVVICDDIAVTNLITDRVFNLQLAGHTLAVNGVFAVNPPKDPSGADLFATMEVGTDGGRLLVYGAEPATLLRDGVPIAGADPVWFSINCPGVAIRWGVQADGSLREGFDLPQPGCGELNVRAFNGCYGGEVADPTLGIITSGDVSSAVE